MHRLLSVVLISVLSLPVTASPLVLGAADWCPYSCPDAERPGIVTEYLTWLLAKRDIQLQVEVIPWSRAIAAARNGQMDGLLTLVPSEAPDVPMTSVPTMNHQNCFYTRPDDLWQFTGAENFSTIRLGAITDYGYGAPLDTYIQHHQTDRQKLQLLSGSNPDMRLFSMLNSRRIDAYVSDSYVNQWQLKQQNIDHQVREAGCLQAIPFYLGISRKHPQMNELIKWLNAELSRPENIRYRQEIEKKYR